MGRKKIASKLNKVKLQITNLSLKVRKVKDSKSFKRFKKVVRIISIVSIGFRIISLKSSALN